MAFLPLKYDFNDVKYALMDNSQAFTIGEVVIPGVRSNTNVLLTGGGTTTYLLGSTMGFKDGKGLSMEMNTYTAASDNVTNALIQAAYLPLQIVSEWITDLSAAANTTTGSGEFGNFVVDSTGLLLTETSYVAFGTRGGATQFFSYGLTGKNTTQVSGTFYATINGALA